MEISREIYWIFFGGLTTFFLDLCFSLTNSKLLFLALLRIAILITAVFYRIVYEKDEKRNESSSKNLSWNRFKNIFVVFAAIEQAYIIYHLKFSSNAWAILHLIEQVAMPLIAYLWIRRIERANFTALQHAWWEIIESKIALDPQSKPTDNRVILDRLLRYSIPDWRLLTFGGVLMLAASLSEVFVPLYTGRLLSSVAFKDGWLQFKHNLIMFVVINFSGGFFGGFRSAVFSVCTARLSMRLKGKLFQAYLKQEIGFFDTNESGKLISRLNHDTQVMSSVVTNNITQFITATFRFVGTFIMMINLSPQLTIACLIGAPLILFVGKLCGKAYARISAKVQNFSAEGYDIAEETIQNIRTVRSFGNEDEELRKFQNTLEQFYKIALIQAALSAAQRWFVDLAQLCMSIVMLSYGAKLVNEGHISGPDLLAFIVYQLTLGSLLSEISHIYSALMSAAGSSRTVFDYLDRVPIQKPSGLLQCHEFRGDIEFKNVSLVYPARPDEIAVQNISFKVNAGEICAFVGPSGSGKTSCINLLERFYDPTEGEILIDGREIHEYNHKYLHRKVAMVGQEPVLFNRTIKENIKYGLETNDPSMITHAAREANAHEFITELSHGYDTRCGQRGGHLSGGQKQRVSIARAIIRKPTILLLDEATSALDPVNERLIQDALFYKRDQSEPRTVLISAHRLSTVERCDRIFVIHKGHLIEQGTHEELMAIENGLYRELVRRQRMNIDDEDD